MSDHTDEIPQGQSAYRRLLEEIRNGVLEPGMRLREVEIAERLGLSRTPVREAMRLLEGDGLVVHQPRLGATVRALGYAEIMELYEMRAVLEGTAARLAARAASEVELSELTALNAEFAEAIGHQAKAAEINRQFHMILQDAAKNRFLIKSISSLQKTMMILGPTTLLDADRAQSAVGEHGRIMAALNARDGVRAEAEMRAHIEAAQRARLKGLRARERAIEED
ncbi:MULTISPECIES: GntR family transcriptional regulator [Roseobacteraceae]|uniref:GntR family transcriptional regulator n=1 Tax=Celeribacter baekdonensis B30 TaxID=1208323 RepID=K2IJL5_9RHOB|nr:MULTISPECIES: GntR family transcriptional regulator [Roseobacteraceae]EKE70341.1 GntR family transcriptional regulator [Celeribacter baekdonensis B30]KAB6715644.1 GntR family transcriptional regulator [Roseobacter sp. TSBP12]|tara:strand:+ start:304 stop:975 length:672 start_codon:yes stop_codon:yes gene_type:complete